MRIRDILVHLDGGAAAPSRLGLAADLAQRLDAHLAGLFVADVAYPLFAGDLGGSAALAEAMTAMLAEAAAEGEKLRPAFEREIAQRGLAGEWRQVEGITARVLGTHGMYADLVVMGQPDPEGPDTSGAAAVEAALFETGRPILLAPYAGHFSSVGARTLIGWNASPQAARAVHDAIPLLDKGSAVTILVIDHDKDGSHGEEAGADIARHLARHELDVTVRRVHAGRLAVGDVLLNEASETNADLVIMGAYGHSRLREMVLGGATRTLLQQMTAPVLMAH